MNVGLPGTGIGGLFYLITAFLMPVVELVRTMQGRSSWQRWSIVGRQTGLASGVVGCLWATGYAVGHVGVAHLQGTRLAAAGQVTRAMGVAPSLWTYLTLGSILLAVECGCLWFARAGQPIDHASEGA